MPAQGKQGRWDASPLVGSMSAADEIVSDLKCRCAEEMALASARAAMADLLEYTVRQLMAQGFSPELTLTAYGMIELRFDPDRIDLPEGD